VALADQGENWGFVTARPYIAFPFADRPGRTGLNIGPRHTSFKLPTEIGTEDARGGQKIRKEVSRTCNNDVPDTRFRTWSTPSSEESIRRSQLPASRAPAGDDAPKVVAPRNVAVQGSQTSAITGRSKYESTQNNFTLPMQFNPNEQAKTNSSVIPDLILQLQAILDGILTLQRDPSAAGTVEAI